MPGIDFDAFDDGTVTLKRLEDEADSMILGGGYTSGIDFDAFDDGTKDLKKQEDVVDSLILEDDEDDELISEPPKKMKDDISESKPKVHNDEVEVSPTTSANNYDNREKEIVEEPKEESTGYDDSKLDEP